MMAWSIAFAMDAFLVDKSGGWIRRGRLPNTVIATFQAMRKPSPRATLRCSNCDTINRIEAVIHKNWLAIIPSVIVDSFAANRK